MKTVDEAISAHGARHVYQQVDFEPGCRDRMIALGLSAPVTLGDIWRAHRAAYEAMTERERIAEAAELRVRLDDLASGCKAGIAPRMPREGLTRDRF